MNGRATPWSLLLSVALLVFGTNLEGVLLSILGLERDVGMIAIGLAARSRRADPAALGKGAGCAGGP